MISLIHGILKKKKKEKNPNPKQQTNKRKKTHRHREQIRGYQREKAVSFTGEMGDGGKM